MHSSRPHGRSPNASLPGKTVMRRCPSALARHPDKLRIINGKLSDAQGELSHAAAIERAVQGSDRVISLLGQGVPVKGNPIDAGTRNILAAMQKAAGREPHRFSGPERFRPPWAVAGSWKFTRCALATGGTPSKVRIEQSCRRNSSNPYPKGHHADSS